MVTECRSRRPTDPATGPAAPRGRDRLWFDRSLRNISRAQLQPRESQPNRKLIRALRRPRRASGSAFLGCANACLNSAAAWILFPAPPAPLFALLSPYCHPPRRPPMHPLRILIADDHSVVRAGLRALLESRPGWEVVAEASDGREAVEKAAKLKPEVAVIDIGMPLLNGVEATRRIRSSSPSTEILILTMHESDDLVQQVVNAGARGYILKDDADRILLAAIDSLRYHKPYFSTRVSTPTDPEDLPISAADGAKPPRSRL